MPYEEIQIRIDREGWVWVDARGLSAERVRALSDHLEEVFGPRVKTITDPTEMPPQVINLEDERRSDIEALTSSEPELIERRVTSG